MVFIMFGIIISILEYAFTNLRKFFRNLLWVLKNNMEYQLLIYIIR